MIYFHKQEVQNKTSSCADIQTAEKCLTNEEKYGIIIKLSRRDAKNLEKNSLFLYGKQNHIEKEFEKS